MTRDVLIVLHAGGGTVAFAAGLAALRRPRWFPVYLGALLVMAASVAVDVLVTWSDLDAGTRVVFVGLLALAGVMVGRGLRAAAYFPERRQDPAALGHVGFTLVGLADAFAVVTLLNAGVPAVGVVVVALLIAAAGHLLIGRAQRHAGPGRVGAAAAPATTPR